MKKRLTIERIRKFMKRVHRKVFKGCYCAECGYRLRYDGYDGWIDRNIYKCEKCGKRWC